MGSVLATGIDEAEKPTTWFFWSPFSAIFSDSLAKTDYICYNPHSDEKCPASVGSTYGAGMLWAHLFVQRIVPRFCGLGNCTLCLN